MKLLFGITLTALMAAFGAAHSQSRKEIYELQERCGKSAAEMFDRDFPKEDRKVLSDTRTRYNVRLNKCFILEENMMYTRPGQNLPDQITHVVDVRGNKVYGSFSPLNCDVREARYRTEREFRASSVCRSGDHWLCA
jgi:hypothetical protein